MSFDNKTIDDYYYICNTINKFEKTINSLPPSSNKNEIVLYKFILENFRTKLDKIFEITNKLDTVLDYQDQPELQLKNLKKVYIIINKLSKDQDGGMNFFDFDRLIDQDIQELNIKSEEMRRNNDFIFQKIAGLNARFNQVLQPEKLFDLQKQVEWLVNQLENKKDGNEQIDLGPIYQKIKIAIEQIKRQKINPEIIDSIKELEKKVEMIERSITSNSKIATSNDVLKAEQAANLAGGLIPVSNILEEQYNEKMNTMIREIVDKIQSEEYRRSVIIQNLPNVEVLGSIQIYERLYTINNLILQIKQLISLYDTIINKYKEIIEFAPDEIINIKDEYNKFLEDKNTNYYKDLLKKNIYIRDVSIKVEDFLSNINLVENIIINYRILDINQLDDTFISLFIIINVLTSIIISINIAFDINQEITRNMQIFLLENYNNLPKSKILYEANGYIQTQLGGSSKKDNKINKMFEEFKPLYENRGEQITTKLKQDQIKEIYKSYIGVLKENKQMVMTIPIGQVNKMMNIDQLKNIFERFKIIPFLIKNISEQLKKDKSASTAVQVQVELGIDNFAKFNEEIQKLTVLSGGAEFVFQDVIKPRLDKYKKSLEKCYSQLLSYKAYIKIFSELMTRYQSQSTDTISIIDLINLNTSITKIIDLAINSYINVIPMIFFTVEFPRTMYKKDKCKLKFKPSDDAYSYTLEVLQQNGGSGKGLSRQSSKEIQCGTDLVDISYHTHARFFEETHTNTTSDIIEDNIVGLNKLINSSSKSGSNPINKVINMMFAIGASGTGKTSRYFGIKDVPGVNQKDTKGIVTSIIDSAKKSGKTIDLAYFVFYGRIKDQADLNNFDEQIIFIIDEEEVRVETEYLCFIQPAQPAQPAQPNYSDFYTNLVNKKLQKINLDSDYITKGKVNLNKSQVAERDQFTFREILTSGSTNKIWKNIGDQVDLTELFNKKLAKQKELRTVLPTRNNIESSRGHTCVLIRMTDRKTGLVEYFPLFDMAGTENTDTMTQFLTGGSQISSDFMAKLILLVNKESIDKTIINSELKIGSLMQVLDSEQFKSLISSLQGGSNTYNIEQVTKDTLDSIQPDIDSGLFLNKIINEGFYINHTITMLIFAAVCIGQSINSTKSGQDDTFDNIGRQVSDILGSSIRTISSPSQINDKRTLSLLNELSFKGILEKSSIWIQVLFSFLYWNDESEKSFKKNFFQRPNVRQEFIQRRDPFAKTLMDSSIFGNTFNLSYNELLKLSELREQQVTIDGLLTDNKSVITKINDQVYKKSANAVELGNNLELLKYYYAALTLNKVFSEKIKILKLKKENLTKTTRQLLTEIMNLVKDEKIIKDLSNNGSFDISEDLYQKILARILPEKDTNSNKKGNFLINVVNDDEKMEPSALNSINDPYFEERGITDAIKLLPIFGRNNNDLLGDVLSLLDPKYLANKFTNRKEMMKELNSNIDQIQTKIDSLELEIQTKITGNSFLNQLLKNDDQIIFLSEQVLTITRKNQTIDLSKIIGQINKLKQSQLSNPQITSEQNQIARIKDGDSTATKMVLMHLVTGQNNKLPMVQETLNFAEVLWQNTQLDF